MGNQDGVPGSRLWLGPTPAMAASWGKSQWMGSVSLLLLLKQKNAMIKTTNYYCHYQCITPCTNCPRLSWGYSFSVQLLSHRGSQQGPRSPRPLSGLVACGIPWDPHAQEESAQPHHPLPSTLALLPSTKPMSTISPPPTHSGILSCPSHLALSCHCIAYLPPKTLQDLVENESSIWLVVSSKVWLWPWNCGSENKWIFKKVNTCRIILLNLWTHPAFQTMALTLVLINHVYINDQSEARWLYHSRLFEFRDIKGKVNNRGWFLQNSLLLTSCEALESFLVATRDSSPVLTLWSLFWKCVAMFPSTSTKDTCWLTKNLVHAHKGGLGGVWASVISTGWTLH